MITTASVEDIRPSANKPDSADLLSNAQKIDGDWVSSKKKYFVEVNCPCCSDNRSKKNLDSSHFSSLQCLTCNTLYQNKRLPEHLLGEFYARSKIMQHFHDVIFPSSMENRINKIYTPRIKRVLDICQRLAVKTECFIDVGAGSGIFLSELKKQNVFSRTIAVEPSQSLADDCRKLKLETFETPVEQMPQIMADVISSFEVLEHLFSPEKFLKSMNNLLRPGGICFLTTPNSQSFEVIELGIYSTTLGFTHLNLFTPESIKRLAQKTGFEVVDVLTPGILDIDLVRQSYISGKLESRSQFVEYLVEDAPALLQEQYQDFLVRNNLSSHMWVVLQKGLAV